MNVVRKLSFTKPVTEFKALFFLKLGTEFRRSSAFFAAPAMRARRIRLSFKSAFLFSTHAHSEPSTFFTSNVCHKILYSSGLWRPWTVMRNGCYIPNKTGVKSLSDKRPNRGFPASPHAFNKNIKFLNTSHF